MSEEWAVPEGDSSSLLDSDPPPNGRQAELEQLIRQHDRALVNYVYGFLRSRGDAEEVVQEAYCRVCGLSGSAVVSHFNRYIYRAARNIAIDRIRERVRRETFLKDERGREKYQHTLNQSPSPEQVWVAREELEALSRAIEDLSTVSPKAKAAFVLIKRRGLSYEEAAVQLRVKPNSVRRLVDRAIEYLVDAVDHESSGSRKRR